MNKINLDIFFKHTFAQLKYISIILFVSIILIKIGFDYYDKKNILTNQVNTLNNLTRENLISGNTKDLYLQSNKIIGNNGVTEISFLRNEHLLFSERIDNNSYFPNYTVESLVKFNPKLNSEELSNVAGKLVIKFDIDGIYLFFITSILLLFIYLFVLNRLINFKFLQLNKSLILPLNYLVSHLKNKTDKFNLEFSNFQMISEISQLIDSYNYFIDIAEGAEALRLENERKLIVYNISRQVSHDIRSPLSALNMALTSIKGVDEDRRMLIINAVQRINDIANELLLKTKTAENDNHSFYEIKNTQKNENISLILEQIISEKCIQYSDKMNVNIRADDLRAELGFVDINASDLKRILSNLINNSVESFRDNTGEVIVSVRTYPQVVQIIVSDNGCGISLDKLNRLGEKGFTFSKHGNGLGIYHAKKTIEDAGGKFDIISKVNVGTTVTITLRRILVPDVF